MDNINIENKNGIGKKKLKSEKAGEEFYRVVINNKAQEALELMLLRANDNFSGGEITKSDLTNWLLIQKVKSFSDSEVKIIRSLHFDDRKAMAKVLKSYDNGEDIPENLKEALRLHLGFAEEKKRSSRLKSELSTENDVDNNSDK